VPKNKVAAEKWFPTVRESDSPIGMALLFGSLLPSLLLAFIFNPCF
jgi:hypothetical protein